MLRRSQTYTKDISEISKESSDKENKLRTRKLSNSSLCNEYPLNNVANYPKNKRPSAIYRGRAGGDSKKKQKAIEPFSKPNYEKANDIENKKALRRKINYVGYVRKNRLDGAKKGDGKNDKRSPRPAFAFLDRVFWFLHDLL